MHLPEPIIPRKCKKSAKYLGEQETSQNNDITEEKLMYKPVYFNAVGTIIARIKERFDQSRFKACQSFEKLLTDATHGREYQDSLIDVLNIYHQDVTTIELEAHLQSLETYFDKNEDTTLADIIEKIRQLPKSSKVYFSQVITLLKILLVLPVTNAVSERSALTLHRIQSWLRTSMT